MSLSYDSRFLIHKRLAQFVSMIKVLQMKKGRIFMSRILFSPIGGSDPIRNFRDGSMLHICRNYLPDQVYLYLSYEMCVHHEKDDRYRYCIEKL